MELVFVHPAAAVLVAAVVVPLAALWAMGRRTSRARSALGLPPAGRRSSRLLLLAVLGVAVLASAAAANPVLLERKPLHVRTDAEAYVVLDITRSMLAERPGSRDTRLQRAKRVAVRIRAAVPDVPVGLASFTNRVVPHLFPTTDSAVFGSGLRASIAIEQPPPDRAEGAVLTAFDSLAAMQTHNFFSTEARRRVAVVVTDGETNPVQRTTVEALRSQPVLDLVVVRVWDERERIRRPRRPGDRDYRTDPTSTATLTRFAEETGARIYDESEVATAATAVRRLLGKGEAVRSGEEVSARSLAGWTFALAFVPLGYILWRRNL